MLLGAGYDGSAPLVDPFCGAGTIPIEAALLARRMAPGLRRAFQGLRGLRSRNGEPQRQKESGKDRHDTRCDGKVPHETDRDRVLAHVQEQP